MTTQTSPIGIPVDASPEILLERGITLPPQPRILQELSMMTVVGDPALQDLAALIAQDPGLTAALYRMARSPLFGCKKPPQSVEQLVMLMGTKRTIALTHSVCLEQAVSGDAGVLERFWARSTAIAQLASLLVAELPPPNSPTAEQAYLAGMFHDCGVPVLMQRFPDYCRATGIDTENRKWADAPTEDALFSVDHAVIGYLLARHWRLPDWAADAVRFHHEQVPLPDRRTGILVATLQLAMHLYACEMGLAGSEACINDEHIAAQLGIAIQELPDLSEWVLEKFHTLAH